MLTTQIVFITGAAQGIGEAIARALANEDRTLLLADLNVGKLTQVVQSLKPKCKQVLHFVGDLTEAEIRGRIVNKILQDFGHIDVLINNAGVTHTMMPITQLTDDDFDFNFTVNTKLPFQLIHDFLPSMQDQNNGLIINISSAANILGYEGLSIYSATKAALSSLTESVAAENKDKNIKAISILPSRTNTAMQIKVRGVEEAQESQPPEFVAEVIRKLVDGEVEFKTGDDIRIREGKFVVEQDIFSKSF